MRELSHEEKCIAYEVHTSRGGSLGMVALPRLPARRRRRLPSPRQPISIFARFLRTRLSYAGYQVDVSQVHASIDKIEVSRTKHHTYKEFP